MTRDQRLLFSIVVMLFAILVTLTGFPAMVGLIIGVVALVIALALPATRT